MIKQERLLDASLILAGAILWMISHPYAGIYHDATVYTVMALNWLDSQPYVKDPWFLFGSQDAFSLFSPIYGALIALFGISEAARLLVIMGAICWLAAAWLIARRIQTDTLAAGVAFLSCAVFSLNISPAGSTFVLNENFATARVVAIPLAAIAVAWPSKGRSVGALMLAIVATLLHPLYGIWAVLASVAVRRTDRWLVGAMLSAVILFLLLAYSQPLQIFSYASPDRMAFLQSSTHDLLVEGGGIRRLNSLMFWVAALLLGARYGRADFRRSYAVIALLAAVGYFLSAVVSSLIPMQFFLQSQPWRAVWLAAYFSVQALVDVAWVLGNRTRLGWYCVAFIAAALLLCKPIAGFVLLGVWAILGLDAFRGLLARLPSPSLSAVRFLVGAASAMALPGLVADVRLDGDTLTFFGWAGEDTVRGIIGGGAFGLGPLAIATLISRFRTAPWRCILLLFPLSVWATMNWDTRGAKQRKWEESLQVSMPIPFDGFSRGQTVYWAGALPRVWFELGTSGYIGANHLSGLVFSEERSNLVVSRWRRAAIASVLDKEIGSPADEVTALQVFSNVHPERDFQHIHAGSYFTEEITSHGVAYLCADPALDWVVTEFPTVGGIAFELPSERGKRFFAYSCRTSR